MKKTLEKARQLEREIAKFDKKDRPKFHLTPFVGWMNDPNGFSFYKGRLCLFLLEIISCLILLECNNYS